uniref:Uncharacterized protein n=1 Tax=Leptobrachium leishanense TaxID=445787 RepID=A0A8C5ME63_9ANUR
MGQKDQYAFPQDDGHYSLTELRMLAAALGFSNDAMKKCIPAEALDNGRLSSKDLRKLFDMGCFTSVLDFTSNLKNGLYNVKVFMRCLDLLERKILSFADIQKAKMAFSAYEHLDQRGVRAETRTILNAMKMCGFAISPQKLSMHLRNRSNYVEEGRVQLYEFLDLLACCEPMKHFVIKEERVGSTDKTSRGMYQMNDMRSLVVTPDEKLERHLNWRFQHVDSWQLPLERSGTKDDVQSKQRQTGKRQQPPRTKSGASSSETAEETWTLLTPVPHIKCHCYTPTKITPILSEDELQDTQNDIDALLYQMATLGERSRWELNWKLDYYLPGYRQQQAPLRHKPAATQAPRSITKKSCKADVFERLSAPRRRIPSPCHAMTCNALKLGISNMNKEARTRKETSIGSQWVCSKKKTLDLLIGECCAGSTLLI